MCIPLSRSIWPYCWPKYDFFYPFDWLVAIVIHHLVTNFQFSPAHSCPETTFDSASPTRFANQIIGIRAHKNQLLMMDDDHRRKTKLVYEILAPILLTLLLHTCLEAPIGVRKFAKDTNPLRPSAQSQAIRV